MPRQGTTNEMTVSATSPPLVLLAGGLATRLQPMTPMVPKSTVEVASEPFIAHQLRLLAGQGVDDIVLRTGHLGETIEAFVGDGAAFGTPTRNKFGHAGTSDERGSQVMGHLHALASKKDRAERRQIFPGVQCRQTRVVAGQRHLLGPFKRSAYGPRQRDAVPRPQ